MLMRTPLHGVHQALGARMVDFGGWDMPVSYGSQIEEHHAVRRSAGMFDVSHMCVVDIGGSHCRAFLRRLLANDIDKLQKAGKALYSCMLNASGGVIDDLIVYFLAEDHFRMVVNAATREKDVAWITREAAADGVSVRARPELAMIAVQGPEARDHVAALLGEDDGAAALALSRFAGLQLGSRFVARTGYTGEDGFEVVLPADEAEAFWNALRERGVVPAGLGARDTLRLEAGMNLYGQDMDESTTPLESGLAWTVSLKPGRDFIGRAALEAQISAGVPRQVVGLVLEDKGVLRHGQRVDCATGAGEVLSGSFSPTLGKSIALARVPSGDTGNVTVDIRGRAASARVVSPPFVREGKALI